MAGHSASGQRVAFIGLGVMGRPMVANLIGAGFRLTVFNRSMDKARDAVRSGAKPAGSIAEAVEGAEFVVTMVGYPDDVRAVYFGGDGILAHARPGAVLIDMTTSEPALAKEIHTAAAAKGIAALDAPVSGGDVGALGASLSIMVGGDPDAIESARPLLEAVGSTVVRQGPPGSGQHTKMCNQIAIAGTMIGTMEALLYARRSGLDPERVLESIGAGAAASWTLSNLYPRALRSDWAPGFYVRHFAKDIGIALAEAEDMGLELEGLDLARTLYDRLMAQGGGSFGTQALYLAIDEDAAADAAPTPL